MLLSLSHYQHAVDLLDGEILALKSSDPFFGDKGEKKTDQVIEMLGKNIKMYRERIKILEGMQMQYEAVHRAAYTTSTKKEVR